MPNKKVKVKDEDVIAATDNEFVADLDLKTMKLTYTKDFYVVMNKLLKNGKTAIEAYEALGFDTKKLGVDRAYAAAQRARKLGERKGYGIDPSSYDGSVPREKMGELTVEEELAYQQARILYLEKFIEFQKKSHQYWRICIYHRKRNRSRQIFDGPYHDHRRRSKGKRIF